MTYAANHKNLASYVSCNPRKRTLWAIPFDEHYVVSSDRYGNKKLTRD